MTNLLSDIHLGLMPPPESELYLVRGQYDFYHYNCDRLNDSVNRTNILRSNFAVKYIRIFVTFKQGWGCGYRTLQTICSWLCHRTGQVGLVPSFDDIQRILVEMEDKPSFFRGSREWIGSFEVLISLNSLNSQNKITQ